MRIYDYSEHSQNKNCKSLYKNKSFYRNADIKIPIDNLFNVIHGKLFGVSFGTLNIRTDVTFTITGNSVTSSTGNLQGTFWNQVDDSNSGISWTEVHQAA